MQTTVVRLTYTLRPIEGFPTWVMSHHEKPEPICSQAAGASKEAAARLAELVRRANAYDALVAFVAQCAEPNVFYGPIPRSGGSESWIPIPDEVKANASTLLASLNVEVQK